ncbi:MAG: hypothetical protein JO022_07535 [Acidobacteriaceae bacterium]|nr:hypothetical protein [Acidobacteriaceae bacterium]
MKRRDFTRSVAAAMFAVPLALLADDDRRRYYDKDRKDYHEWNEHEDRAYRHWLEEQHRKYVEWNRTSAAQQREYWRWRHEHPGDDWDHDRR